MKIEITKGQLKSLINEHYDRERLYNREAIVNRLSKAPMYIKKHVKDLPSIECTDQQGNTHICTKLPQFMYEYLFGTHF